MVGTLLTGGGVVVRLDKAVEIALNRLARRVWLFIRKEGTQISSDNPVEVLGRRHRAGHGERWLSFVSTSNCQRGLAVSGGWRMIAFDSREQNRRTARRDCRPALLGQGRKRESRRMGEGGTEERRRRMVEEGKEVDAERQKAPFQDRMAYANVQVTHADVWVFALLFVFPPLSTFLSDASSVLSKNYKYHSPLPLSKRIFGQADPNIEKVPFASDFATMNYQPVTFPVELVSLSFVASYCAGHRLPQTRGCG